MFDKLKEMNKLRQMQNAIASEKLSHEKNGVRVVINGSMIIEELSLNGDLPATSQERAVKDCINEAMQKIQVVVAKKMQSMMQ